MKPVTGLAFGKRKTLLAPGCDTTIKHIESIKIVVFQGADRFACTITRLTDQYQGFGFVFVEFLQSALQIIQRQVDRLLYVATLKFVCASHIHYNSGLAMLQQR